MNIILELRKFLLNGAMAPAHASPPESVINVPLNEPDRSMGSADPQFERDLENLLKELKERDEALVTGSVELVGLDNVREALGERWHQVAEHALRIAASEIRRLLSDEDFFRSYGDTRFVICFGSLHREQAIHKASLIARSIRARLLEELPEIQEQTSVNRFVTEVDPKDIGEGGRELADRLAATLDKIQGEVEFAAAARRRAIVKDFQLLFAPSWQVRTQLTVMNRCLIDTSLMSRALAKLQLLGDGLQVRKTVAELDCLMLARSVERLHAASSNASAMTLLVPVTFSTFLQPETRRSYVKLLSSVPAVYLKHIILEIRGIDNTITVNQILWLRDRLGSAQRIALELPHNSALLPMLEPGDIHGIGVDLGAMSIRSNEALGTLRSIVNLASEARLATFAHNAKTLGLAGMAIEAGFQNIDGPAVHLNTLEPRPPVRLKPMVSLANEMRESVGRPAGR